MGFLLSSLKNKQRGIYKLATLNFDRCTGDKKRSQIQEAFQVAVGQVREIVSITEQMPHVMVITSAVHPKVKSTDRSIYVSQCLSPLLFWYRCFILPSSGYIKCTEIYSSIWTETLTYTRQHIPGGKTTHYGLYPQGIKFSG